MNECEKRLSKSSILMRVIVIVSATFSRDIYCSPLYSRIVRCDVDGKCRRSSVVSFPRLNSVVLIFFAFEKSIRTGIIVLPKIEVLKQYQMTIISFNNKNRTKKTVQSFACEWFLVSNEHARTNYFSAFFHFGPFLLYCYNFHRHYYYHFYRYHFISCRVFFLLFSLFSGSFPEIFHHYHRISFAI